MNLPLVVKNIILLKNPNTQLGVFDLILAPLKAHQAASHHDGVNAIRPRRHDVNAHATHFFDATQIFLRIAW